MIVVSVVHWYMVLLDCHMWDIDIRIDHYKLVCSFIAKHFQLKKL